MKRTEWLQETRKMRFEEAYGSWQANRLTQEDAAQILGVSDRTFRRYIDRYEDSGLEGLLDKRLSQASHRRAPLDEVMSLQEMYRKDHSNWNAKHFHSWYRQRGGKRSYTWVKSRLQEEKLIPKKTKKGVHRKRRDRAALPGMMIHQDASTHEWVPGQKWDLVVTMDDATSDHYSMFFCPEEGTQSSFRGVRETIESHGLFCTFYSDRGSHYWHTPVAGGKVDKVNLTQFGRALKQLGITMIAAYSPEARGRSERMFATHQGRLPNELALVGITTMEEANRYLKESYQPEFNKEFRVPAREEGTAFIPYIGTAIHETLCEQYERTVGGDNCVRFENMALQIPSDQYRCNYIRSKVRVHRYQDGTMGIYSGPRRLASYDNQGRQIIDQALKKAA